MTVKERKTTIIYELTVVKIWEVNKKEVFLAGVEDKKLCLAVPPTKR